MLSLSVIILFYLCMPFSFTKIQNLCEQEPDLSKLGEWINNTVCEEKEGSKAIERLFQPPQQSGF